MRLLLTTAAALTLAAASLPAHSAVITLDFEGVGDLTPVGDFYNGGDGEDFGIGFSENALAIVDQDAGGNGNFGNEPTPDTILFFLTGDAATLNFAEGFTSGFSFFYSAINSGGSIDVYDDLGATGNVLATLDLAVTPSQSGDPTGQFNVFVPVGVEFDGTARSIDFGGTIDQIGFDNITFGSATPGDTGGTIGADDSSVVVPLPAAGWLLFAGLGGLGLTRRRRSKRS